MFVRKIYKTGKYSRGIVIPKEVLKKLRWRDNQRLEITPDFKSKSVVIKDYKASSRK